MLEEEISKLETTEYTANNMLVPEKDELLQFLADFKKLNAEIELDSYPIDRTDVYIESFEKSTVFSPFDANCGY